MHCHISISESKGRINWLTIFLVKQIQNGWFLWYKKVDKHGIAWLSSVSETLNFSTGLAVCFWVTARTKSHHQSLYSPNVCIFQTAFLEDLRMFLLSSFFARIIFIDLLHVQIFGEKQYNFLYSCSILSLSSKQSTGNLWRNSLFWISSWRCHAVISFVSCNVFPFVLKSLNQHKNCCSIVMPFQQFVLRFCKFQLHFSQISPKI
jgi:hypothetical protein